MLRAVYTGLEMKGPINSLAVEIAEKYCVYIKAAGEPCGTKEQCTQVCDGMIPEEADIVLQALFEEKIPPELVCEKIGMCQKSDEPTYAPSTYPTQEYSDSGARPASGNGLMIHVSDIHVDPDYIEGANLDCGFPLCCRNWGDGKSGNATHYAAKFGPSVRDLCDAPYTTITSMLDDMRNYVDGVAATSGRNVFGILTGDYVPHNVWNQSKPYDVNDLTKLFDDITSQLPNVTFYPALGNHETFPVDEYQGPGKDQWLYSLVEKLWSKWLPEDALATVRYGGYYTAVAEPGLRIVSLNSGFYQGGNFWLTFGNATARDMGAQLSWFKDVMSQARKMKEKVYVLAHVPLDDGATTDLAHLYANVLCDYRDIVEGVFMGHSHSDQFHTLTCPSLDGSPQEVPTAVEFMTPSITTYDGHWPSWRVYDYNRVDKKVVDYEQRYMDLQKSNEGGSAIWGSLYRATTAYNIPSVDPESMFTLASRFAYDDAAYNVYSAVSAGGGEDRWTNRVSDACAASYITQDKIDACVHAGGPPRALEALARHQAVPAMKE